MEETLKNIIRTLCLDFKWYELNQDKFKNICFDVVKSIYKTNIIINPSLYPKKDGTFEIGYELHFNIVGHNNYGEWGIFNFIIEIDDKHNVKVNINFIEG